ncbi:NTP transferase domain-containing protein [Terasakiella sp. A23]|uniref:NTP transferase domain-containing protein n=1 Tax=Terasakiella sp. FCG-A23 TaxID=3080561 RepID=UPI00295470C0|nr:NTP transferase domain-containing protein [Terasakiella sp. A23]MDV7341014.1 NTP transferase domain-containing protein [Terasakiella sp. A23]
MRSEKDSPETVRRLRKAISHAYILISGETEAKLPMAISAVILCAGEATRWHQSPHMPKQLVMLGGEALLHRSVRLLKENGVSQITVVALDERLRVEGCDFFSPADHLWIVETLKSSESLWAERTIILLGDVYYSEAAMAQIVGNSEEVTFFGREGPSPITLSSSGELFALSFQSSFQRRLKVILSEVIEKAKQGKWGKLWDVYGRIAGPEDVNFKTAVKEIERVYFHRIYDLTEDVDTVEEFKTLQAVHGFWQKWQVRSLNEVVQNPVCLAAYFDFGKSLFNRPSYEQALGVFDTILRVQPDHTECKSLLGLDEQSTLDFSAFKSDAEEENLIVSAAANYIREIGPRTLML